MVSTRKTLVWRTGRGGGAWVCAGVGGSGGVAAMAEEARGQSLGEAGSLAAGEERLAATHAHAEQSRETQAMGSKENSSIPADSDQHNATTRLGHATTKQQPKHSRQPLSHASLHFAVRARTGEKQRAGRPFSRKAKTDSVASRLHDILPWPWAMRHLLRRDGRVCLCKTGYLTACIWPASSHPYAGWEETGLDPSSEPFLGIPAANELPRNTHK
ncbi:hypothetical protein Q7P37_010139 [Cladosporium fusiforme]